MIRFVKKEFPMLLMILIPFITITVLWDQFPDRIPIHWSMDNNADGFADKFPGLFIIPALNIGIYLLFLGIPNIDKRRQDFNLFNKTFYWLRFGVSLFMLIIWSFTIISIFGTEINIGLLIIILIILLFLGLGITFLRTKQNPYIGIRLPWTLKNKDNWEKTHKFGGKVWVIGSMIMLLICCLVELPVLLYIFLAWVFIIIIVPVIYSYRLSRQDDEI